MARNFEIAIDAYCVDRTWSSKQTRAVAEGLSHRSTEMMIFIGERVVLAWWLLGQGQNPGQIHHFCRSVRDTGQELQIRDCPGRSGTVGTYAVLL